MTDTPSPDPADGIDAALRSTYPTGEAAEKSDTPAEHSSDHPGREYPPEGSPERGKHSSKAERSHSSGVGSPSEPRRPGTGERQAPLRENAPDAGAVIPGEILLAEGDVVINEGLEVTKLQVVNSADRPVQVGSHFHFAEINAALEFDREAAWGKRLNVLSGGSVRFEPGAVVNVELIPIEGQRVVLGLRGLSGGALDG